ncbi:MAG TPA: hypothetical protein VMN58_12555 [Acidimicrobiales bacterium]|nr:hypothetical protein [Acidimicrobiales bacterium]
MKGKWAQGIVPRNFAWVLKDRLAVSERLGGYGESHRRVRRQEEIIWAQQQGFTCIVSLLASPHNLHAYEEAGMPAVHIPFTAGEESAELLTSLYGELHTRLGAGEQLLVHQEEVSDTLQGAVAGYLVHAGMVPEPPRAIAMLEHLVHRQMGPTGRRLVTIAARLTPAGG